MDRKSLISTNIKIINNLTSKKVQPVSFNKLKYCGVMYLAVKVSPSGGAQIQHKSHSVSAKSVESVSVRSKCFMC